MKKLIIVRHGDYDNYTERLNKDGEQQITELAKKIEEHVKGCSLCILSSTAPRADDSAIILSKYLNISYEPHLILWSDNDHCEDYPEVLRLIRQKKDGTDVIIIITHMEYTDYLPYYFMTEELRSVTVPFVELSKGSAALIDCETSTMIKL